MMPANVGAHRTRCVRTQRWRVSSLCPLAKVGTIGTRCARLQLWAPLAVGVAACECWYLRPFGVFGVVTACPRCVRLQTRVPSGCVLPAYRCGCCWSSLYPHANAGTIGIRCTHMDMRGPSVFIASNDRCGCDLPVVGPLANAGVGCL